jgi:hypothetical protein
VLLCIPCKFASPLTKKTVSKEDVKRREGYLLPIL